MLKLIGDEPRHGYDIIREIESLSDGAYAPSPGLVYPTLTLLADMDLIAEQGEGGARKSYAITDAGKAELDAKADEVKAVLERLGSFAGRGGRDSIAPALRAMQNLAATMRNKVMQSARTGEMSQEDLFKIVDIIDEAAQKIERL
ncbi:PadR family transcriptional regulator [Pseudonocardia sp. TMWB2A]|uniref:PadR family transcriptional regulator n=1 Tax=Pseudonocardia sp. TMWB2A TaxID=687430 RepID=UPI00307D13D7